MLIKRTTAVGGNDLRTIFRPCTLDEFIGSVGVKNILSSQLKEGTLDHTILISGPSGCGKTTLARIIALVLNCSSEEDNKPCLKCLNCTSILNQNSLDYVEVNVGSANGKADVDNIVVDLATSAFSAANKVIVFDEAHKLTEGAKDLLLKKMEDTYGHVYLIFCTNKPEKLADTKKGENPFLDRCTHFILKSLRDEEILAALENVCQFEGVPYSIDVLKYITEISKGVPRKALKSLGMLLSGTPTDLSKAKELLEGTLLDEEDAEVMELSKAIMRCSYKRTYDTLALLLKKYEVETIRIAVAGMFVYWLKTASMPDKRKKITQVLDFLTNPIYLTGKPAEHIFYNCVTKAIIILSA